MQSSEDDAYKPRNVTATPPKKFLPGLLLSKSLTRTQTYVCVHV